MQSKLTQIRKRDGSLDKFDINRIATAIKKAAESVNIVDIDLVKRITLSVINVLEKQKNIPTIDCIQDVIEKTLIEEGQAEIAKAYIIYRKKRDDIREAKKLVLGKLEKLKLSETALLIAREKYLRRDDSGKVIEVPEEMFKRVSSYIAQVEKNYNKDTKFIKDLENKFFKLLSTFKFVPAGRILANAGTKNKQLHSSFVLPVNDDISEIFKTVTMQTTLQKYGAGVGFSFSKLRPKDSLAKTSSAYAAGPVAFIEVFNAASNVIKQVSSRKAANLASLSVHHPDILEFISAKQRKNSLSNFNISVEVTNEFMEAVLNNKKYFLINPTNNKIVKELHAKDVFTTIATMAWKSGEPGILFIDEINKDSSLSKLGRLETTDPCGDQPLLPYEGAVYGAINLSNFVKNNGLDWEELKEVIELAVRFLDNCIDVSEIQYKEIEEKIKMSRKISLGVMGFADMLYKLMIPYNSDDAVLLARKISSFIYENSYNTTKILADEKGHFPNLSNSDFKDNVRNASLLAISPTGSRSILADTSPGIEPNFALGYVRKIFDNTEITFINKIFEETAKKNNFYSEDLIKKTSKLKDLRDMDIPKKFSEIFVTAHNIDPLWHLKIQAAFQENIDNAVSKTINFPSDCTIKDIEKTIILAYNLGVKGLTVYRDSSRADQVINILK